MWQNDFRSAEGCPLRCGRRMGRGLVGGERLSDECNIRCQMSLEGESVWMI